MVSHFGWNKVRCPQRCLLECDKQALNSSAMETGNIPCRRSQFRHKAKNITEVFPGNHKYRCHYKCTTGLRHYSWETCCQKRHFPCCENGSRLLGHIWSSLKKRKSLQLSLVPRIPPASIVSLVPAAQLFAGWVFYRRREQRASGREAACWRTSGRTRIHRKAIVDNVVCTLKGKLSVTAQ